MKHHILIAALYITILLISSLAASAQNITQLESIGGMGADNISGVVADHHASLYLTGTFSQSLSLTNNEVLQSNGQEDVFIIRLDTLGQIQWSRHFGSAFSEESSRIHYKNGLIYTCGFYWDSIAVDTFALLEGTGGSALYIMVFDTTGQPLAASTIRGAGVKEINDIIATDDSTVFLTGSFTNDLQFHTNTLTASGATDMFLASWQPFAAHPNNRLVGFGNTGNTQGIALAHAPNDHLFVVGQFDQSVTLGTQTLTSGANDENAFVMRIQDHLVDANSIFDANSWVSHWEGVGDAFPRAIKSQFDQLFVTGYFQNSIRINDLLLVTPGIDQDALIAQYDTSGTLIRAKQLGGIGNEFATSIAIQNERVLLGGYYIEDGVFDGFTLLGDPFRLAGFVLQLDTSLTINAAQRWGQIGKDAIVNDVAFLSAPSMSTPMPPMQAVVVGQFLDQMAVGNSATLVAAGSFDGYWGITTALTTSSHHYNYDNNNNTAVKLFPNPADASIHVMIDDAATINAYWIHDSQGKLIRHQLSPSNNNLSIHTQHWKSGIYFLTIEVRGNRKTLSFSVQH